MQLRFLGDRQAGQTIFNLPGIARDVNQTIYAVKASQKINKRKIPFLLLDKSIQNIK
jgi:hypothetical protein